MQVKRVFFFSDLHIGCGDSADDFSKRAEKELIKFIRENAAGSIFVFVGDTFELLENPMEAVLLGHPKLFERLYQYRTQMLFITGNHDRDLPALSIFDISVNSSYTILSFFDKRVLVLHGDKFDPVVNSAIGRFIARIVGYVERNGCPNTGTTLGKLWKKVLTTLKDFDSEVIKLALKCNCNAAIYGHLHVTHYANVKCDKPARVIEVFNTGTWREAPYPCAKWDQDGIRLNEIKT